MANSYFSLFANYISRNIFPIISRFALTDSGLIHYNEEANITKYKDEYLNNRYKIGDKTFPSTTILKRVSNTVYNYCKFMTCSVKEENMKRSTMCTIFVNII